MPDYQPYPSPAMRRQPRPMSDEEARRSRTIRSDLEPAPQPRPAFTYLALFLLCGFVALQMYPSTHWRHPQDKLKRWIPHEDPNSAPTSRTDSFQSSSDEVQAEQTQDSASQDTVSSTLYDEKHDNNTLAFLKKAGEQVVHIFVSTDGTDFRPLSVLVNSSISNAVNPERLHFHLILPPSLRRRAKHLAAFFQKTKIEIVSDTIDLEDMKKRITFRKNSEAEPELQSVYNFVPFILPKYFKDVGRLIFLDADVVVKGNIEELMQIDLENKAVAAVEDCSRKLETYFDFDLLAKIKARPEKPAWIPAEPINPNACVLNEGVLVIDTDQWNKQQLTEAILWWIDEFRSADSALYKYEHSQPPFLLALYGRYKKLDTPWNVRGLGRNEFSEEEREYLERKNDHKLHRRPFISLDADTAKILHYNGKFKPWKRARPVGASTDVVSICGLRGIECAKIWWEYLDPVADGVLRNDNDL